MTDEVELFVDGEPLIEPQVGKRYETIAGNDESVQLADDEDSDPERQRLSSFLELWVFRERRHYLRRKNSQK